MLDNFYSMLLSNMQKTVSHEDTTTLHKSQSPHCIFCSNTVQRFLPSARSFPHFEKGAPNLLIVPRSKSTTIHCLVYEGDTEYIGIPLNRSVAAHSTVPVHAY